MKRYISALIFPALIAGVFLVLNVAGLSGQTVGQQIPGIPDDVAKILKTSCNSCHGNTGGMMAKSALNLDTWQDYPDAKKAEKAAAVCKELTKGAMPPKMIRESKPELIPTEEQTDLICKWADSFKPAEEQK